MAKTKNVNSNLSLTAYEQSNLRILLLLREEANQLSNVKSATLRNFLIQILGERKLDPQKWGVSPDMTTFVEIQQPQVEAPAPPIPVADPNPNAQGPAAFAESAPSDVPATARKSRKASAVTTPVQGS